MDKIYDTLTEETQTMIDAIVDRVKDNLTVNNNVDLDLLMATLEQMNQLKKDIKEKLKKEEDDAKEAKRIEAVKRGRAYAATLKQGDMITFIYGSSPHYKTATLPIVKIGAATIQVNYTPDMLGPTSSTTKRNIRFNKIVVPEDFVYEL